jgi:hypothetical protein
LDKLRRSRDAAVHWLRSLAAQEQRVRLLSWAGVAVLLALVICFGRDAGITYDEEYQIEYGDRVLAWYRSGFKDDAAMHYNDLYLYGGLFDMCAQWLVGHSVLGQHETRHLLTALLAVLGVVATARMAARVGGEWAGLLAGLMLALTPTWVGHGLFNPKDIPLAVAAAIATSAATRLAMGPALPSWGATGWAGFTVGTALAVRPGSVFILGYPLLAAGGRALLELSRRARAHQPMQAGPLIGGLGVRGLLVLVIAWLVMLSAWPWAQLSPFEHPLQAMVAASRFAWKGDILFDGAHIDVEHLPRAYLPTWFAITLPEIYQVALACALVALARMGLARRRPTGEALLGIGIIAVGVLLPLTAVFVLRPVIYDAHRHFLFFFPPLAALAGIALADVLGPASRPVWLRALAGTALALLALRVAVDMVALHPYEYVYFNRSFGGLPRALNRYETDYWGASYKEGLEWLVHGFSAPDSCRPLRVTSCDPNTNNRLQHYIERWPGVSERMRLARDYEQADVFLAVTRDDCHKVPGKVLHRVRRQHVPLLYVIRAEQR